MLTRIDSRIVRHPDGRTRRVWYQEATADVVLVHDVETGQFLSFEIEWEERGKCRRAYVVWSRGTGLRTGRVDTGEEGDALRVKAAPVVLWDWKVSPEQLLQARRLIAASAIEEGFRDAILARLAD